MSKARVLVIDDEDDVLQVLKLVLSKHGYEVATARSGMDGLMSAQSERPDVILLDIMMGEMDGWEVLKLFRLDEHTRSVPVIILSARVEPKDKIRGLQEGALDYITKPFSVRDILDRVAGVLHDHD